MPAEAPERSVLFVCLDNQCRSPAAAAILRHLVLERGLAGEVRIGAAGLRDLQLEQSVDHRMQAAAARRGLSLEDTRRQVVAEDIESFNLLIAMDRHIRRELNALAGRPRDKIRLLSDYLPPGSPKDVPDPFHGDGRSFEAVLDLLQAAGSPLLDELLHL